MSNIKQEIVSTLKKILGFYEQPKEEPTEDVVEEPVTEEAEAFNKVYSENEIKISQMEVGGKVELIDANGELADAPDGDYELENGKKFQVKDGLIASIEGEEIPEEEAAEPMEDEGDVPADEPIEEPVAEEDAPVAVSPEDVQKLWDKISELEETLNNLTQSIEGMQKTFNDKYAAFTKQVEEVDDKIRSIAKIPVEFSKTNTNNVVKENKEEKLLELARMLGKK